MCFCVCQQCLLKHSSDNGRNRNVYFFIVCGECFPFSLREVGVSIGALDGAKILVESIVELLKEN
jgi:hypothetical protein